MISKNEISNYLSNVFKTRRTNAKLKAEQNLNEALKNEKFKKSFYLVRSLQFDLSKLNENTPEAKKLEQQIEKEKVELNKQLKICGFSKEDLKPHYICKKCCDTGFVNGKKCSCYKAEQNKIYLIECGINKTSLPKFSQVNFEIFGNNKTEIKKIYDLAKSFVDKFNETTKQNIIIVGNTGVGKTYLTECLLNEAINNDIFSIYTTAFNLNQTFLKYHIAKFENKQEIIEPYLSCDLLIIDDLGSENKFNNVTIEYLYLILNERARNNLKTIVTTNLSPEQIQLVYEDRVFSRLFNKQIGIVLQMPGDDLRFKKQA